MTHQSEQPILVRHDLRPGDLGRVTELHGMLYAAEYGFDHRFEAYVAATLAELAERGRPQQDRLWIAERGDALVGSVGVIGREGGQAQLRWLLVHPDARGQALGRRLVAGVIDFSRAAGYRSLHLWTVGTLTDAARLYLSAGFRKTERKPPACLWGAILCEERYDLALLEDGALERHPAIASIDGE